VGHAQPRTSGDQRSPDETVHLEGDLSGPSGEAEAKRAIEALLRAEPARATLDLTALRYADDDVGRMLARATAALSAHGHALTIIVNGSGTLRFLRRHRILPLARVVTSTGEEVEP
jgi:anti-anti-sigma regulatory factor